jgi:hypothetical protein
MPSKPLQEQLSCGKHHKPSMRSFKKYKNYTVNPNILKERYRSWDRLRELSVSKAKLTMSLHTPRKQHVIGVIENKLKVKTLSWYYCK